MKRFFYSSGAKALLFLLLLLSSTIMTLSLTSVILLGVIGAYNTSETYVRDQVVGELLTDPVRKEIRRYVNGSGENSYGAVDLQIRKDSSVVFQTEESDFSEQDQRNSYTYYLYLYRLKEDSQVFYHWLSRDPEDDPELRAYDPELDETKPLEGDERYSKEILSVDCRIHYSNVTIYSIGESLVIKGWRYRFALLGVFFGCLILTVILYVFWVSVSGKKAGTEEVVESSIDRIPLDLCLLFFGTVAFLVFTAMIGLLYGGLESDPEIVLPLEIFGTLILFVLFLFLSATVSVRIKAKKLFYNTVIGMLFRVFLRFVKWLCKSIGELVEAVPLYPGALVAVIGFVAFEILWTILVIAAVISADNMDGMAILLVLLIGGKIILYGVIIPLYLAKRHAMAQILRYCRELAEGNFTPKSEEGLGMRGDLKRAGGDLNSVSEGMNLEMERRMKSERMKTELITNVSHDLKTPLTSIINYSDLIRRECDGTSDLKVIREYSEVLTRQSGKLKRLIEDLVEVSKASSGVLEVSMSPCDGNVLLIQSEGEYEERFQEAGLEVVLQTGGEDLPMMADPRRMWRVFENLYGNICKYSLPGSRVYLTARKQGEKVQFLFRNISRDALDISPEELMERFVRGDRSRNTEGNGLGLSIARSMTELQNGTMKIEIDGDFFKVTLEFPLKAEETPESTGDSDGEVREEKAG